MMSRSASLWLCFSLLLPVEVLASTVTSTAEVYAPLSGGCTSVSSQNGASASANVQCPGLNLTSRAMSFFPVFDAEVFFTSQAPPDHLVGAAGFASAYFSGWFFLEGIVDPVSAVFRFDLQEYNGFLLFEANGMQSVLRSGDTTTGPIPIQPGQHFGLSWLAVTNGAPLGSGPGWVYGSLLGVDLFTPLGEPLGQGQLIANPEPSTLLLTLPALVLVWQRRRARRR